MRRKKCRRVSVDPEIIWYKPAGTPLRFLETIELPLDELEALRLADMEGLYHEEAGQRMGLSRASFGRILGQARQKVAIALIEGKCLVFRGGNISLAKNHENELKINSVI